VSAETGWHRAAVVPLATEQFPAALADGTHDGTILFVGRLVERKGCGWFIRQVLPLLPRDTRLLVAGTAWEEREHTALAEPGVEFLGPVHGPALIELYSRAKCVILPNIEVSTGEYEGFGLVAPEAAAAGGLVLAARCDGLVDAVIDGTTGLLVESGNPVAWAESIRDISSWDLERRRRFLIKAQAAAANRFCWSRVARDTRLAYALDDRTQRAGAQLVAP
jgi:glycosyltransferase involved in cell wall biosynthesis